MYERQNVRFKFEVGQFVKRVQAPGVFEQKVYRVRLRAYNEDESGAWANYSLRDDDATKEIWLREHELEAFET